MSVTIKKSELREGWKYEQEFHQVCGMFNDLSQAEQCTFKGFKLQFLGLLFAPPSLLKAMVPQRESWFEWVVKDLQGPFNMSLKITKSGTPLDFLIRKGDL